jgi:hypothetical protein
MLSTCSARRRPFSVRGHERLFSASTMAVRHRHAHARLHPRPSSCSHPRPTPTSLQGLSRRRCITKLLPANASTTSVSPHLARPPRNASPTRALQFAVARLYIGLAGHIVQRRALLPRPCLCICPSGQNRTGELPAGIHLSFVISAQHHDRLTMSVSSFFCSLSA